MGRNNAYKLRTGQQQLLTEWFQSRFGSLLAERERACLEEPLSHLFGYHLVQIGVLIPRWDILNYSPVKHKVILDVGSATGGEYLSLRGDPLHLPLETDSIDGVLMHHSLDFSDDPHQLLREVERVLIPEGRLIIVGFNPWSLCGLKRLIHLNSPRLPWKGHFFPTRRVGDWLSLLGFDLESVEYLLYRPPLHNRALMQRLAFMERLGERIWPMGGCVYVMEAIKRSATLTPIKPRWRIRNKVSPAAVEPTARNIQ